MSYQLARCSPNYVIGSIPTFKRFCSDNDLPLNTMSNFDIIRIAKQLKIKYFRGVYMRDSLPKTIRTNECGIVNLEPESENGSHWCCYYKKGSKKYYFDSYGLDPTNEMLKYLKQNNPKSEVIMNTYEIQKFGTVICGQISLYVLFMLSHDHQFIDILLSLMTEFNGKTGGDLNDDIEAVDSIATIAELLL